VTYEGTQEIWMRLIRVRAHHQLCDALLMLEKPVVQRGAYRCPRGRPAIALV